MTVSDVPEPEPREPATSFKWVIVTAIVIWVLGGAMIFLARY